MNGKQLIKEMKKQKHQITSRLSGNKVVSVCKKSDGVFAVKFKPYWGGVFEQVVTVAPDGSIE